MAYTAGNLICLFNGPPGKCIYRYDTTEQMDAVGAAGYFNNADDNLNLQKGDIIHGFTWATAVTTGTLSEYKLFGVTNVIANDAAASAGAVNIAELQTTGTISSNV